jgi:RNA polymerase sigma-70 factor, ECF subfamily
MEMDLVSEAEGIDVEALYRRYGGMVLRRCQQLLGNDDLAADAMQETFMRMLRPKNKLHARYPSSLLYRIATNICLNAIRTRRRRPTVSAEPFLHTIAGRECMEDRILDSFELEMVFAGAAGSTRTAAEMLYLEGRTLAETAAKVDLSVSGVRKRLRTLREKKIDLLGM